MSNTARRTSITYPNGRVVNLGYGETDSIDDLFSLVKSAAISGEGGNKADYTRAGLGRFVKIAYPQPAVELSMIRPGGGSEGDSGDPYDGYDRFGRVQEMRWQKTSDSSVRDAWQWGYNEASNRMWKKNLVASSGQDEAYGYDGLHQVIRDAVGTLNTNRTAIGGIPGEEEDFTYDPTGNWLGYRKDANGSVVLDQSRSNNKDNQLTQIDGSSSLLAYDRAGNATKVPPGTAGDWSKYYQPVWDAWGRLVEVKNEVGTTVQKYTYDGLSRRITKEADSVVTHTYWSDRWKPLEERLDSETTVSEQYLWGERPGHRDELVLRDRDTDDDGTLDERLYATMDYFNGTAVLNTSGVVQERYAYSAFGVRRIMEADFTPRTTSDFDWDFGFQGQFRDGETGWYNYGYRFYVPLLGRWINRDPIGESGGKNTYSFVENSPQNYNDLLGLAYGSETEAARAACSQYFELAAENDIEYGGNILKCIKDGIESFEFTVGIGTQNSMPAEAFEHDESGGDCPCKVVSWWHVHPKLDNPLGANERIPRTEISMFFSPRDIRTAENTDNENPWGKPMKAVLCNPIGETRYYDPNKHHPYIGGPFKGGHPGIEMK